jgi:hypothetical protein
LAVIKQMCYMHRSSSARCRGHSFETPSARWAFPNELEIARGHIAWGVTSQFANSVSHLRMIGFVTSSCNLRKETDRKHEYSAAGFKLQYEHYMFLSNIVTVHLLAKSYFDVFLKRNTNIIYSTHIYIYIYEVRFN